jgi:hypothetical protein
MLVCSSDLLYFYVFVLFLLSAGQQPLCGVLLLLVLFT